MGYNPYRDKGKFAPGPHAKRPGQGERRAGVAAGHAIAARAAATTKARGAIKAAKEAAATARDKPTAANKAKAKTAIAEAGKAAKEAGASPKTGGRGKKSDQTTQGGREVKSQPAAHQRLGEHVEHGDHGPASRKLEDGVMGALREHGTGAQYAVMQGAIREHLDSLGMHKRDAATDTVSVHTEGHAMEGAAAYRGWDGHIVMGGDAHRGMMAHLSNKAFEDSSSHSVEAGYAATKENDKGRGLETLIHENVHGYGPVTSEHYRGRGVVVEEVSTEVTARSVMREQFGLDMRYLSSGSYHDMISGVGSAMERAMGARMTRDDMWRAMETASRTFKSERPGHSDVSALYVRHLAHAMAPGDVVVHARLAHEFNAEFPE